MNRAAIEHLIKAGEAELTRLQRRMQEAFAERSCSVQQREEWERACAEFHGRYGTLAFPGGYDGAVERLLEGDPFTVEATLCFLEARPYFFRSGYMFSNLLRKAKRAPLSAEQAARLREVVDLRARWRAERARQSAAALGQSARAG